MGRLQRFMEASIPGVYVHSIMVGGGPTADTLHGYFGNVDDQVKEQCVRLLAEPRLANGFFASASPRARSSSARSSSAAAAASVPATASSSSAASSRWAASTRASPTSPVAPCTTARDLGAFCRAAEAAIRTAVYPFHPRLRRAGAVFQGPGAIR